MVLLPQSVHLRLCVALQRLHLGVGCLQRLLALLSGLQSGSLGCSGLGRFNALLLPRNSGSLRSRDGFQQLPLLTLKLRCFRCFQRGCFLLHFRQLHCVRLPFAGTLSVVAVGNVCCLGCH